MFFRPLPPEYRGQGPSQAPSTSYSQARASQWADSLLTEPEMPSPPDSPHEDWRERRGTLPTITEVTVPDTRGTSPQSIARMASNASKNTARYIKLRNKNIILPMSAAPVFLGSNRSEAPTTGYAPRSPIKTQHDSKKPNTSLELKEGDIISVPLWCPDMDAATMARFQIVLIETPQGFQYRYCRLVVVIKLYTDSMLVLPLLVEAFEPMKRGFPHKTHRHYVGISTEGDLAEHEVCQCFHRIPLDLDSLGPNVLHPATLIHLRGSFLIHIESGADSFRHMGRLPEQGFEQLLSAYHENSTFLGLHPDVPKIMVHRSSRT